MPSSNAMRAWLGLAALAFAAHAGTGNFGHPGGPLPANLGEVAGELGREGHDLELLISFGTSRGGSAGHLALAIRGESGEDTVYSANFYADRDPAHEKRHYTDELMVAIPKMEYLFGKSSVLGEKASFGLDFGEVYKRSVIGVRVFGVPPKEKQALAAFFRGMNDHYRRRVDGTEYHSGEIKYGYLELNCAKSIGAAFHHGAGYADVEVKVPKLLPGQTRVVAALNANIPTEMALKLLKAWNARGYKLDAILYRKYPDSGFIDPREEDKVAFRDLPDRFPSVLSRDFRREEYRDADNLFAMRLLDGMRRYTVAVNGATQRIEIERAADPLPYARAAERARP
jgi:hypothetical protein